MKGTVPFLSEARAWWSVDPEKWLRDFKRDASDPAVPRRRDVIVSFMYSVDGI